MRLSRVTSNAAGVTRGSGFSTGVTAGLAGDWHEHRHYLRQQITKRHRIKRKQPSRRVEYVALHLSPFNRIVVLSLLNNRKLTHVSLMPKEIGEVALPKSGPAPKLDDEVACTQFIFVRLAEDETLTRIVS
jgi:hypothetical protein